MINEKKQYFNKYEFIKVKNLSLVNPEAGIKAYQEYFRKYPKDYSGYGYYISLLINLNKLDQAANVIDFIEQAYFEEPIFKSNRLRANTLYHSILYCKLRLLAYQKRYRDFLSLYYNNTDKITDIKEETCFYFKKQIGEKNNCQRDNYSYLYRQIIEYREDDFKDHLKKHLADYNGNDSNYSVNIFDYRFPVDEVLNEIKKYIPSDKKLCLGFVDNTYVFKYNECGRDKNKLVDYFKVITFNDTSDIITMCPTMECEHLPYVDLNYMKEKDDEVKVKRLSQIDKFNMRYKRY